MVKRDISNVQGVIGKYNRISIMDFEMESTTIDLKDMVEMMKDLIKNYTSFVGERYRANLNKTSGGYYG